MRYNNLKDLFSKIPSNQSKKWTTTGVLVITATTKTTKKFLQNKVSLVRKNFNLKFQRGNYFSK